MKCSFVIASALTLLSSAALAGGRLDEFKFTGNSSVPGFEDVEVVGIFWDQRCSNVNYVVDDVPANAGTPQEISPATIRQELQTSFNQWNQIPTSYINMNVVAIRALNNGVPKFDFINELSFEAPPGAAFLAVSPSMSLQRDTDFAAGDDLDEDGDSDVFDPRSAGRNSCFDIDGDGDIEFPAGKYKAGTILDNDVLFNPQVIWSTLPGDDNIADIQAVAVHEFGHSHGLSHSAINQISRVDGTGSTMFPFIDIANAGAEIGQRDLHSDDIAWSSFIYQEGTALTGPAALQRGDKSFRSQFGLIKGEVVQAGVGVAGASVTAITKSGEIMTEGFSGTTRLFSDPATGIVNLLPTDPLRSIVNGLYSIPVPRGAYDIAVEALDNFPVEFFRISITSQIGGILGQNLFPAEFRSVGRLEDDRELLPALSVPVIALNGLVNSGTDIVTNQEVTLRNAGLTNRVGTALALNANDVIYAERFTNAEVRAQLEAGANLASAQFHTLALDAQVVPRFKRAGLFFGRVNADGTVAVDLSSPVFAASDFVGEDDDTTPVYASLAQNLALKRRLLADSSLDVFAVLEANNEFETGASTLPPLLRLNSPAPLPAAGRSFFSSAGSPLRPLNVNWSIELHFTAPRASTASGAGEGG